MNNNSANSIVAGECICRNGVIANRFQFTIFYTERAGKTNHLF
jgi:hypothetical protein